MTKSVLFIAVAVTVLAVFSSFSQTNAQCCLAAFTISHVCKGIPNELPLVIRNQWNAIGGDKYWARQNKAGELREEQAKKCMSDFCADGSHAEGYYCCVGECLMNGRFCENGCREGNGTSYMDMKRAWLTKHGFVRLVEHYF